VTEPVYLKILVTSVSRNATHGEATEGRASGYCLNPLSRKRAAGNHGMGMGIVTPTLLEVTWALNGADSTRLLASLREASEVIIADVREGSLLSAREVPVLGHLLDSYLNTLVEQPDQELDSPEL
jgi:hypothetical protein